MRYLRLLREYTTAYPWMLVIMTGGLSVVASLLLISQGTPVLMFSDSMGIGAPPLWNFTVGLAFLWIGILFLTLPLSMIDVLLNIVRLLRDVELPSFAFFSTFAFHLSIHHRLSWRHACQLSGRGIDTNIGHMLPFMLPMIACLVVAPFLGIVLPWLYCVYKEIFTGSSSLEQRQVVERVAHQTA